jgi:hypothetical protein
LPASRTALLWLAYVTIIREFCGHFYHVSQFVNVTAKRPSEEAVRVNGISTVITSADCTRNVQLATELVTITHIEDKDNLF